MCMLSLHLAVRQITQAVKRSGRLSQTFELSPSEHHFLMLPPQVIKRVVAFTVCRCLIANSWMRRHRAGTSIIDWHLPPGESATAVTPRYG